MPIYIVSFFSYSLSLMTIIIVLKTMMIWIFISCVVLFFSFITAEQEKSAATENTKTDFAISPCSCFVCFCFIIVKKERILTRPIPHRNPPCFSLWTTKRGHFSLMLLLWWPVFTHIHDCLSMNWGMHDLVSMKDHKERESCNDIENDQWHQIKIGHRNNKNTIVKRTGRPSFDSLGQSTYERTYGLRLFTEGHT